MRHDVGQEHEGVFFITRYIGYGWEVGNDIIRRHKSFGQAGSFGSACYGLRDIVRYTECL